MDTGKKLQRQVRRFAARIKSTKGILCVDTPENNIVLCNVGKATGLEKDKVLEWIKLYCPEANAPKFIAEKGETHSFLVFENINEACSFHAKCNGIIKSDNKGTPVYLTFVKEVPSYEVICEYGDPPGLSIFTDIITLEEEKLFIKLFDWEERVDYGNLRNRLVKHYGYEFRYGSNDVDLNSPLSDKIPEQCQIVFSRLRKLGIDLPEPDQLTVNKYSSGQGIPSHVDRHSPFGSTILSLSLGSSIVMDWKHHSGKYVPVTVPGRSLLVMQNEARYDWQHCIQPRMWDPVIETRTININGAETSVKVITNDTVKRGIRISLTFRWTRFGPCECAFRTLCDSVASTDNADIEDKLASNLENVHVHQVYEQIAGHFSTTRFKPWPRVVDFLGHVTPGAVVIDLGCGNGKNVLLRNDVMQLAGERSTGLLSECKSHIRNVPAADCIRLDLLQTPLRDECADYVICIAVIHHFSSKARRLQSISTISRLLRPGGHALITVWAKDQTKSNYLCKTKKQKQNERSHATVGGLNLPVHENRTQFQHNDVLVPWKLRSLKDKKLSDQSVDTLLRFYHVFEDGELEQLCQESPKIKVESSFYDEGNWCVICKKI